MWRFYCCKSLMPWLSNSVSKEHIFGILLQMWSYCDFVWLLHILWLLEMYTWRVFLFCDAERQIFKIIEDTECKRKWGKKKVKEIKTKILTAGKSSDYKINDLSTNFKGRFMHHPWISVVAMHLGMKTVWLLLISVGFSLVEKDFWENF